MTPTRTYFRSISNNQEDPNKNICLLKCARVLHVDKKCRYLHTPTDLVNVTRKFYDVIRVPGFKHKTLGSIRQKVASFGCVAYIVHTERHVYLLSRDGMAVVDTDPRKRDRRKVLHIWGVKNRSAI